MIFLSSLVAGYESYQKFLHPEPLRYVWWVIAAAIVGFFGNEAVAVFRIRIGREIGSAALVADGQHARVDGLTSLAVLLGAVGSLLGFPLVDPIVGIVITVAILFIVFDLEIAFLFPWAVALGKLGLFGLGSMAIFLGILVVGFIYEWKKGALEWD